MESSPTFIEKTIMVGEFIDDALAQIPQSTTNVALVPNTTKIVRPVYYASFIDDALAAKASTDLAPQVDQKPGSSNGTGLT
jgi:hypothetical protein